MPVHSEAALGSSLASEPTLSSKLTIDSLTLDTPKIPGTLIFTLYVGPFLIQSDSASRKRLFSTGLFFDWVLLVLLLIVSRVDFIVFVLFLEAVGVRAYCCTAVEIGWQLCASRFLRKQRLDKPSSQRVGGFGLSRKPPKLRSWSHTQPRAVKATAGAAVVGSMGSIPCAAAVV